MALKIVFAQPEHLHWLRLLYAEMVAEEKAPYPHIELADIDEFTRMMATMMSQPEAMATPLVFLAIQGHTGVGFLSGQVYWRRIGSPHVVAHTHQLFVTERHRHRHVAARLMETAISYLDSTPIPVRTPEGVQSLRAETVEVPATYGSTRWERAGFTPYLVTYQMPLATAVRRMVRPSRRKAA